MIAEVIIDSNAKKLNRIFDYIIPKNLEDLLEVGSRVIVPFGDRKELEQGYIIKIKEKSDFATKKIIGLEETLSKNRIELARWMARKYFCNVSECIKLMLTPGTQNKQKEKRITDRKTNFVYLNISKDEIDINSLRGAKQKKAMQFILNNEGLMITEIMTFADVSRVTINSLIKKGYIKIEKQKIARNPLALKSFSKDYNLKLTKEQQDAFNKVSKTIEENKFEEFLLYGVTGSGKTEIYIQLIEKILKMGKTAIMLVPEISLTPQMLDRFISRFGKEILAVLHSRLSIGERHDEWVRIKNGDAKIVIGARSAIFAPLENIGIIIIDEEHDNSYKSETSPRYDTKEVAVEISKQNKNVLLLGSATPDVNTFYMACKNQINLLKLSKRANKSKLPNVEIVDLKLELAAGNKSMISKKLYKEIKNNIENKRQTILFLNRRGYSTFVMCRNCGYTIKCPNCNITLTYHSFENKLKCHYCGHEEQAVRICPKCKSNKIRYFGTGTQKLEQEIKKLFPNASTIRMDVDTVTKKNSHENILNKFKNENIDILIGTQMVVKGHHFPNVTLVGVVAADSSLNIDDYRANERTFQILTQVAGRAGREALPGKVIIQTYNPNHFIIEFAKKQDYDLFYKTEIELRKQLLYPPFCDIIVIGFSGTNESEIIQLSHFVYNIFKTNLEKYNFKIFKPSPAPIDKIKNKYRWRFIVKGKINKDITIIINKCLKNIYDLDKFKNTNFYIDINPINML